MAGPLGMLFAVPVAAIIKVIIEEFIEFDDEITLLTIRQKNGHTIFCPVIKHEQVHGDFKNSQQGGFVHAEQLAPPRTQNLAQWG